MLKDVIHDGSNHSPIYVKFEVGNMDIKCTNFHRASDHHREQVDEYAISILKALETAGSECLPSTLLNHRRKKSKTFPGWNDYVRPHADES